MTCLGPKYKAFKDKIQIDSLSLTSINTFPQIPPALLKLEQMFHSFLETLFFAYVELYGQL